MIETPLISIITPIYNAEKHIEQCINSVLNQSYLNWELILIDDCSIDNSLEKIEGYLSDSRIKLFKNSQNIGPAESRNIGLENAEGEYITFLDSDDFWYANKLENQLNFMIRNNLMMSHGNYYFCDINGKLCRKIIVTPKINYLCLLKGNQFKIMTVMLRKELIGIDKFKNIKHEDYSFFLELLKKIDYSLSELNNIDSFCRIGNSNSVSANKFRSAIWTWNIFRKDQKLPLTRSVYYFFNYAINGLIKYRK